MTTKKSSRRLRITMLPHGARPPGGHRRFRRLGKVLGPGFVTGASDDDPSGIGTYAQAGASLGYATLWTAPFTFPLMTAMFDVIGIFGGYLVGVELLGLSAGTYFGEMQSFVDMGDVMLGFWKSVSFGIIVTWVCTYKGFHVGHGAEGVARATTQAVVMSSVLILVWDYFLGTVLP